MTRLLELLTRENEGKLVGRWNEQSRWTGAAERNNAAHQDAPADARATERLCGTDSARVLPDTPVPSARSSPPTSEPPGAGSTQGAEAGSAEGTARTAARGTQPGGLGEGDRAPSRGWGPGIREPSRDRGPGRPAGRGPWTGAPSRDRGPGPPSRARAAPRRWCVAPSLAGAAGSEAQEGSEAGADRGHAQNSD